MRNINLLSFDRTQFKHELVSLRQGDKCMVLLDALVIQDRSGIIGVDHSNDQFDF